ncbi:ImmA/IrrE family metallo-endopeptidase [Methylocystis sp.]|uniref:ImmA/IrrE family metallo-endopeptidase n=1 Tax=Methylocystis sp. TaxID=1911079 RepID=UPI003DA56DAF
MAHLSLAERLLQELGITEPNEIDLEAIAYHVGAHVRYQSLDGCEARIIGHGDQAIITVNSRSSYRRNRFSIAHELGHWRHHRGRCLVCRATEVGGREAMSPERVADDYAADLLLPNYLFKPIARQHPKLDFASVKAIADLFEASQTSTAIRLVEADHAAALLICHGFRGRKWFVRSPSVPSRWFPRDNLDPDGFAFGILHGGKSDDAFPRRIGASAWFDHWEASRYDVFEQSFRTAEDEVLTLVLIRDDRMLEEKETRRGWR